VIVFDAEKREWEDKGESASFYSPSKLVCECHDGVGEVAIRASGAIFMIGKGMHEGIEWKTISV
jgi:hypothetical protein